jgi:hypothetical protein
MGGVISNDIHVSFVYDGSQLKVKLATYGEEAREKFIRMSARYGFDPYIFRVEVEVRASGKTAGMTDTYYYGEGKRFRSLKEIERFYKPNPIPSSDEEIESYLMSKYLSNFDSVIRYTINLCEPSVARSEIQPDIFPFIEGAHVVTHFDSKGHRRTMCIHPYNSGIKHYNRVGWQHAYACKCPMHITSSYWRRLSSKVLADRQNFLNSKNNTYIENVIGMTYDEYLIYMRDRFISTYEGILPEHELSLTPEQLLIESKYVIDEFLPRCYGKKFKNSRNDISIFLAKVFNFKNTQYLIRNKEHARTLGVDVNEHRYLINDCKNGTILPDVLENFEKIVPSDAAVAYFNDVVMKFGD